MKTMKTRDHDKNNYKNQTKENNNNNHYDSHKKNNGNCNTMIDKDKK